MPDTRLSAVAKMFGFQDYPPHWTEWESLLRSYLRLLLIATRDGGKSTLVTNLYPSCRVVEQPGIEVLIVSYAQDQVIKMVSGIRDGFENGELVNTLVPDDGESWSKGSLDFRNGSSIRSLTFGSSGRGSHYDLIIVDDPVKDYSGMSSDDQEDYFLRAIVPMCRPDGQIVVVGTFVYENDLIERIQKNKFYHSVEYPAIKKDGSALWPSRWPLDKLAKRRSEIGEMAFCREYLLQKIDPQAQFFKRSMFKFYDPTPWESGLSEAGNRGRIPQLLSTVGSWDPAISLNGDFNAMMVTGTAVDKKTYLMPEYAEFKSDDVTALIDEVFRLTELYDIPYWIVETIGFQKLLKEHLHEAMRERSRQFGINEVKTHIKSKQARIMALQPRIASGSLLFHPTEHKDIIDQFCAFPRGQHDDMIDALSFQIAAWDKPSEPKSKAPHGSMEWWKGQIDEPQESWYTSLTK